jgi:hypothetical protein
MDEQPPSYARALGDTRWDSIRSAPRRRWLVVAWVAAVGGAVGGALSGRAILVVVAIAVLAAVVALLRLSVRNMADLPEEWVDERVVAVRNRAYWLAYVTLSSLVAFVALVAWIAADASRMAWQPTADQLHAFLWGIFGLAIGLPSAVLAWTEPEV